MSSEEQQREAASFRAQFDAFVRPIEAFLHTPTQPLLLPVHLEAIQEGFDLISPMADFLPADTYNAALRCLLRLRSELEALPQEQIHGQLHQDWVQDCNGNWRINLDMDLLIELCEQRFTDEKIARLLGCSASTVKRRRQGVGISKRHEVIEMDALCQMILDVRRMGTGEAGERCLTGALYHDPDS